jgi:hypothetical protein
VRHRSRRWGLTGSRLALCGLLGVSQIARSAEAPLGVPSFVLTYQRDDGADRCPSVEVFRQAVAHHLGHDPFSDTGTGRLLVELRPEDEGLAAHLTLRRDPAAVPGERVLRSKDLDCVVLASTLELVASLDIEAQEEASEAPPPLAAAEPQPKAPSHLALLVALGPLVVFLAAPSTAIGGLLGVEARWPSTSLGLEARADLFAAGPITGGRAETSLALATLVGCAYRSSLGACLLFAAGVESATGLDLPGARSDHGPYVAPGGRLLWEIPLFGPTSLRAQADLLIPVVRSSLRFGDTQVWISPPVSLALGLIFQARIL